MKLYKYTPGKIKDLEGGEVQSPFKGFVEIQILTYKDRMTLLKGLDLESKGGNDSDAGTKLIDLVEKHVKSVDLKYKSEVFKSIEDVGYCKEGTELINHIGSIVVQGIPLGNA